MDILLDLGALPPDIRTYLNQKSRDTGVAQAKLLAQWVEDAARREMAKVVPIRPEESGGGFA